MSLRNWIERAKIGLQNVLGTTETRPKVPRKKLQIQLNEATILFNREVESLEQLLQDPFLDQSVQSMANHLILEVERFRETHLIRITKNRLDNLPESFISPTDFSLWVLYELYAITEEIYHFVDSTRM